eukprot:11766154-Heterocapsa_arctica.AAC.1
MEENGGEWRRMEAVIAADYNTYYRNGMRFLIWVVMALYFIVTPMVTPIEIVMIMPADNIDSVINTDTGNEDERASSSHEIINMI